MVFTWIFNFRPKVTPQGLVAALDLQVPIFGLGNTWMGGFFIFLAQMIPYEYDRLLEYADLKHFHVCANSGTLQHWPVLQWQKNIKGFQDFHENALVQSFKMSSHLIRLVFRSKSLSWAAPSRPDPEMLAIIGFCTHTPDRGSFRSSREVDFFAISKLNATL